MLFWGDPASECAYRYFLDPQDGPKSPFYFANHSFLCNKKSRCTYKFNCYVPDEDGSNFILLSHIIISSECPASKTRFVLIWMSLCCIFPVQSRQTVSFYHFYHHFFVPPLFARTPPAVTVRCTARVSSLRSTHILAVAQLLIV